VSVFNYHTFVFLLTLPYVSIIMDNTDSNNQMLEEVCLEYAKTLVGTKTLTQDGIHSLTKVIDLSVGQVEEMSIILDSAQRDTTVLRDVLLPQLNSNTQHLLAMFQTIDELGALADRMERAARACRDQTRLVNEGYSARHPKKVERFLGSLNMFRSKKNTGNAERPPMPQLKKIEIPNVDYEIEKIRQNAAVL